MIRRFALASFALFCACTLAQPLGDLSNGACRVDGVKNGDETDVDCGGAGADCPRCKLDDACRTNADCISGVCNDKGKCDCQDDMTGVSHEGNARRTCMDDVEVSNQAFDAFVAACPDGCPKLRPAVCAFERSFAHRTTIEHDADGESTDNCYLEDPNQPADFGPDMPVVCVDWCAAATYCAWRGKRLCNDDEWFDACSDHGRRTWPYAPSEDPRAYDPCACNAGDQDAQPIECDGGVVVGQSMFSIDELDRSCTSAPGPSNLVGNAAEWQAGCDDKPDDESLARCNVRGGSYADGKDHAKCAFVDQLERGHATSVIGFRCCGS